MSSGRGGKSGRGGRGKGSGRGRGRGHNYTGTTSTPKKGLCTTLGSNVFDYGQKSSADQMRISWEKLVQYVGITYGQDISNELQNKKTVTVPEPSHTQAVLIRHAARELMVRGGQSRIQSARRAQQAILQEAAEEGTDPTVPMSLAILENEIAEGDFEAQEDVPIVLTDSEKTQHSNEWRTYRERNANLLKHRGQAFSLILGQCTQLLQDRMKQDNDWGTASTSYDPLTLINLISKTVLGQTEDQYPFATVYEQELGLYSFKQESLTNPQWYERFNTKIDVGTAIGVTRQHKVLLEYVSQEENKKAFDTLTIEEQQAVKVDAEERYMSYVFLRQSGKQHGNLKVNLQNDFTTGDNHYPKNRQQTLHLLDNYSKTAVAKTIQSEGNSFAQKGNTERVRGDKQSKSGYDKEYWKEMTCYKCDQKGHPASHCKKSKSKDDDDDKSIASTAKSVNKLQKELKSMKKKVNTVNTQLAQLKEADDSDLSDSDEDEEVSHFQMSKNQFQFTQIESNFEPQIAKLFKQSHGGQKFGTKVKLDLKEVLLLDSQSTMDLFCNRALVENVNNSKTTMRLQSNGGHMIVKLTATVKGYHKNVWYSEKAITNIVALSNVIKQYRVTYDSDDLKFVVHRESAGKPNMEFRMHESGLHYYDPRDIGHHAFVNTVSGNKIGFTKRQIKGAETARALYSALSYPSTKDYKWIIRSNLIRNCPVTVQDIQVASKVWGKDIAALKGKTIRSTPTPVSRDFVKIPKEMMKLHKEVYLTMDIFFVNKIPFLLTLSRKICFTAVNHLSSRSTRQIFEAFKEIYLYYLQRGFRITTVSADGEFAPLQAFIESLPGGPRVNLASANEHVPEIERRIRVVKERCRATRHSLPFLRIPTLLMVNIVLNAVKLLNLFPTKGGISDTISPKTIMSGDTLDYKKDLCIQIGQYCQVHEEDLPRNSQVARTRGAISLGRSGNLQGGFKFMALNTGMKIARRTWDVIPMPDLVIARVNELGSNQPALMTFTDRHGRLVGDLEIPGVPPDDDDELPALIDNDDDELPALIDDAIEIPGVDVDGLENPAPQNVEMINDLDNLEADPPLVEVETVEEEGVPVLQAPAPVLQAPAPASVEPTEPPREPRRSTREKSKPKAEYIPSLTGTKYAYAVTQLEQQGVLNPDAHMFVQEDFYQAEPDVVAIIMTQLSLKAGLKAWGDQAHMAAHSEMKQLHMRNTFKPKHWRELTADQRNTVLESHMFLKEKRDGKIKGRTVAGGNKQRDYISKEDASSPTVATEAVLLSCIIDAEEGRDVAVIDIPNAFIQTRIEDEKDMTFIKLRGVLVDILTDIAPDVYKPYVTKDKKGVKQVIVQCQNALYGTMVASLLYYRKFVKSLTDIGFVINPYHCGREAPVVGSGGPNRDPT